MKTYEKEHFLHLPTPLERLSRISSDTGIEIYMKRDDLTNTGCGGNKLRKLEYFIHDALEKKATAVVTTGGAQTNHGRQTAAVCAKYGLKCYIVTDNLYPGEISANILLDRLFGCEIVFAPGKPLKQSIKNTINTLKSSGENVYYIPMGGSNELGCAGYIECAKELISQCKGLNNPHIYVTAGSLGTYIGLYLGLMESDIRLTGILIAPYEEDVREYALSYYKRCCDFFDIKPVTDDINSFDINTEYTYDAYNNPVKDIRDTIKYFGSMEGEILDPCYTGKTFNAILKMINKGKIKDDETVIFIHTGGMPGIYTDHHRIAFEKELLDGIIIAD